MNEVTAFSDSRIQSLKMQKTPSNNTECLVISFILFSQIGANSDTSF